jgi:hypothetical protein
MESLVFFTVLFCKVRCSPACHYIFTKHNYRAKNNVYLFNYENKLIYNFKIFIFLLINLNHILGNPMEIS